MMRSTITALLFALLVFGCAPKQVPTTQDIVMYANLVNEEEAIRQYEYYHSNEGVWPEVGKAAQVSGILEVKMYRFQNQLIMILTVPKDLDRDEMDRKYANSSKRITEWGALMNKFFTKIEVNGEGKLWVEMDKIHHFKDGKFY